MMKIRVRDRLLVALTGLVLIASSAALIAQAYFGIDLASRAVNFMLQRDFKHIAITVAAALILLLLGVYCFLMLFRRARRKSAFVVQQTETGELSISMKALEGLVQKCVDKHDELHVVSTGLENTRDGLIIRLRVALANGINIPLVVNALQKQIKQYVTACSGVDVREVRVQVDTSSAKMADSPYVVKETETAAPVETPVVEQPAEEEVPEKPAKRPLHQRLFGHAEQPNMVPEPPQPEVAAAAEAVETVVQAAEEAAAEAVEAVEAVEAADVPAEEPKDFPVMDFGEETEEKKEASDNE